MIRALGQSLIVLTIVGAFALCALASEADKNAESDAEARQKLAGNWRGFTVEGKGEKPDQGPFKLELIFSDKSIHGIELKGDAKVDHGEGNYTLDLAAQPLHLDGSKATLSGRKDTWLGIYKLEGETLYWCVAKRQRPTTFETVKGQFLMVLKRAPALPPE